jgi:hypothetical protein
MKKFIQHEDENPSSFSSPPRLHPPPSPNHHVTLLECTLDVGAQKSTLEYKKGNLQLTHKKDLQTSNQYENIKTILIKNFQID